MPSTYSSSLRIELQAAGENLNTWGAPKLNNAFTRFDKAIAGRTAVTLAASNYTLTTSNTLDDEARSMILDLSGTGGCQLIIPSVPKAYFIRNAAVGNVTVTTGAGSTVVMATNDSGWMFCDGSGVFTQAIAGVSIKAYVDAQAWSVVSGTLPAQTGNAGKYLGTDGTTASWSSIQALPTQSGNSGKYLTTDGTNASWSAVVPTQTGNAGKFLVTNGTATSWSDPLPAQASQAGKYLTTNGTSAAWASLTTSGISDLATYTATQQAFAVAMALAL